MFNLVYLYLEGSLKAYYKEFKKVRSTKDLGQPKQEVGWEAGKGRGWGDGRGKGKGQAKGRRMKNKNGNRWVENN